MSVACLGLAAVFLIWPELDLWASGLFRVQGSWLLNRDSGWLLLPYRGVPRLGQAIMLGLLAGLALSWSQRWPGLRRRRNVLLFLLAGGLLGPTLVVDFMFKDHFDRARPINVLPFGGEKQFTGAFIPANECRKNCSFVSGHVAMAAYLMAFGWLSGPRLRRRFLLGSVVSAGVMGLARMIPGGHFLSDAVFAWFAVYYSLWLLEWCLRWRGLELPGQQGD